MIRELADCAGIILRNTGLDVVTSDLLLLKGDHQDHVGLTRKQRWENISNAFTVARIPSVRSEVVLVDDVFTTGATLNACARALKRAGATRVDALTLARVVRERGSDI